MLKSNGGRRRTVIHEGYLENCSSNVFTVCCPVSPTYNEHVCFSYIDLFEPNVVEIAFDEDGLERLLQTTGGRPIDREGAHLLPVG